MGCCAQLRLLVSSGLVAEAEAPGRGTEYKDALNTFSEPGYLARTFPRVSNLAVLEGIEVSTRSTLPRPSLNLGPSVGSSLGIGTGTPVHTSKTYPLVFICIILMKCNFDLNFCNAKRQHNFTYLLQLWMNVDRHCCVPPPRPRIHFFAPFL
jgi:hypothetical protein